jgi:predicted transcriptional regulator
MLPRSSASGQIELSLPAEEAQQQLAALAAELKKDFRKISDADLQRSKKTLLQETAALIRALGNEPKDIADEWKTTLKLDELKTALEKDSAESAVLDEVQNTLYSDREGIRWTLFDALRAALRRYQNIDKVLKNNSYDKQFVNVLDNLPKYVSHYNSESSPLYAEAIAEVTGWLDDVSIAEPRAAKLAALVRAAVSGVNVRLQVSEDFIKAGFERVVNEAFDIDENILGTKVVGKGSLNGKSTAELANTDKAASIRVCVNADMVSDTDGSHPPVTLKTHTTGTLSAAKNVIFSADAITTEPAKTQANLKPEISDVHIDTCCLIKPIVRQRIDSQKADSAKEAALKAEKRLNIRLDDQIDTRITELNERYQEIRQPLVKAGLFPKVWNLSSSEDAVDWSILLATRNQPSAPKPATAVLADYGLAVQVHQSAINNLASSFLAGRFIDEEKSAARLAKYFKNKPKFLERKSDVSPAKVSFGQKAPVDVSFADNKIKVIVRLDDIEVLNSNDKSYVITVEYKVSSAKKDGKDVVVLEQSVAEAYPSSYKEGSRLSAAQTIIRSYLMKRLEGLPKRFEAKPLNLEGEWKNKGQLVPAAASASNGWLTLAWYWRDKK